MHLHQAIKQCASLESLYDDIAEKGFGLLDLIHQAGACDAAHTLQKSMSEWEGHCEALRDCTQSIRGIVRAVSEQALGFTIGDVVVNAEQPESGCYRVNSVALPNKNRLDEFLVFLARAEPAQGGWVCAENSDSLMFCGKPRQLRALIARHPKGLNFSRAQLNAHAIKTLRDFTPSQARAILARLSETELQFDQDIECLEGLDGLEMPELPMGAFKAAGYCVAGRDHTIALALAEHMSAVLHPQYAFGESDLVRVKFRDESSARVVVFERIEAAEGTLRYFDGEVGRSPGSPSAYLCVKPVSLIESMTLVMAQGVHELDAAGMAETILLTVYAQKENLRMRIGRFAPNYTVPVHVRNPNRRWDPGFGDDDSHEG